MRELLKRGWNDKGKVWIVSGIYLFFFFDRSKIFLKPSYSSSRANTHGCDSTRFLSSFSRCYGSLNPAAWSVNLYIFNTCYVSRNCFRVNRLIDFARAVTIVTRWRVDLYMKWRIDDQYFHLLNASNLRVVSRSSRNWEKNYLSLPKKERRRRRRTCSEGIVIIIYTPISFY